MVNFEEIIATSSTLAHVLPSAELLAAESIEGIDDNLGEDELHLSNIQLRSATPKYSKTSKLTSTDSSKARNSWMNFHHVLQAD
jgi:copper homeostasis protein CutC